MRRGAIKSEMFVLMALLATTASAQEIPLIPQPADTERLLPERAKGKEDQIATLFEKARSDMKIPKLTRIEYRETLEAKVCTMAVRGAIPKRFPFEGGAFYKTTQPESITGDLHKLAVFNDNRPRWLKSTYNPPAVWAEKDSVTGETTYWVGALLYFSAAFEFFMNHFTDDWNYRNEWKKSVAPECLRKR